MLGKIVKGCKFVFWLSMFVVFLGLTAVNTLVCAGLLVY